MIDKAVEFLKNVSSPVTIYFHSDTDGVCSAAIVLAYLKTRNAKVNLHAGGISSEEVKNVKAEGENFIFVDLAMDQYPDVIEQFKGKNTLIVDHHSLNMNLNEQGILHINPRIKDPEKYVSCASVCLEICKKAGLENFEWVMKIGDQGDRAKDWGDEEKEASSIISAVKAIRGSENLVGVVKLLARSTSIESILFSDYSNFKKELDIEIERQMEKFKAQEIEDVNFFEVKTNYSIISILSSALSDKYPDKTIIVYRERNGLYTISGRTKQFDIGKVFKEASQGIGGGGGHPNAAGAEVNDMEKFRKKILSLIKT